MSFLHTADWQIGRVFSQFEPDDAAALFEARFKAVERLAALATERNVDAVLVAVELALETGPPGKVSVEHVVNVLGRLNAAPIPPTAATHLKVITAPLADTARYDRLRAVNDSVAQEVRHEA